MLDAQKLSAVAVMAQRGTEHEKEVAKKILAQNHVSIEEALAGSAPKKVIVDIPYKDRNEREIIFQIYASLLNTYDIRYYQASPRKVSFNVPHHMADRLRADCKTVLGLWRKELDRFRKAFVQANNLFPEPNEDLEAPETPIDELMDILSKAESIAQAVLGNLFER